MKKIGALISFSLAVFFPYMPLVHAFGNTPVSHCEHHGGMMTHTQTGDHSMNLCTKIVEEVISTDGNTPEIQIISLVFDFPQKETTQNVASSNEKSTTFHETDPPYSAPHDLVGIVKLTT